MGNPFLRDPVAKVRQLMGTTPDMARFFRQLPNDPSVMAAARAAEEVKLARHFGRPEPEPLRDIELPIPTGRQFGDADPGLFGPTVQRMLDAADYNRAVDPGMGGEDVMDMLRRNERMRTLDRVNAQRYGGERAQLFDIAQQNIEAARQARIASGQAALANDAALGVGLKAAMGGLGATAAGLGAALSMDDITPAAPGDFMPDTVRAEDLMYDADLYDTAPTVQGERGYTMMDGMLTDPLQKLDFASPEIAVPEEELPAFSDDEVQAEMLADSVPEITEPSNREMAYYESVRNGPEGRYQWAENLPDIPRGARNQTGLKLTNEDQARWDKLHAAGVDPQRALEVVRGQKPMTKSELRILMGGK
ncbi:hypothetical protein EBZ80_25590 [bacterium]|nr:hypothetical protein [bacterium]